MADIRETFETAHKVLAACIETMEAFSGFHRRVKFPEKYNGAAPSECLKPSVLRDHWLKLHALSEQLEICYLYDPASKSDILRALLSRPRAPVPAMLDVTAETHVEGTFLIGSRIHDRLKMVGQTMKLNYEEIDQQPNMVAECDSAAKFLQDYAQNRDVASESLDYLRRAVAVEEATCQAFFNPSVTALPRPMKANPPSSGRHRIELNTVACLVILDDAEIKVTKNQAKALQVLLDAKGEFVSLSAHRLRSRDIDELPQTLKDLVDGQPGAGTRIVRDKVEWLS